MLHVRTLSGLEKGNCSWNVEAEGTEVTQYLDGSLTDNALFVAFFSRKEPMRLSKALKDFHCCSLVLTHCLTLSAKFAIILISEHSLNLPDVKWGHDSSAWNNLVFNSLKSGHKSTITADEKAEVLSTLHILDSKDVNYITLQTEFEAITMLDAFFFKIIAVLYDKYKDNNICLDAMFGTETTAAPFWENYNEFQTNCHNKQITPLENETLPNESEKILKMKMEATTI